MIRLSIHAFTLIELLIVIAIAAILGGLVWVGMRDTLQLVKVQKSAYGFIQTLDEAKSTALSTGRVHTVIFNNSSGASPDRSLEDWWREDIDKPMTSDERARSGMRSWDSLANNWACSPFWSDKPKDQWFSLVGPWRDASGAWWQVRGGMPINSTQWHGDGKCYAWDLIDPDGRPFSRRRNPKVGGDEENLMGGIFGHALDSLGRLPLDQRSSDKMLRISEGIWDPYGTQIGPRRMLENGTRWLAAPDNPEWAWMAFTNNGNMNPMRKRFGTNWGRDTIAFQTTLAPELVAGRVRNGHTTCVNVYPSGMMDRNFCDDATSLLPSGTAFNLGRAFIGLVSAKTRDSTFLDPSDVSASLMTYQRPVAMTFITMWTNGDVTMANQPMVTR